MAKRKLSQHFVAGKMYEWKPPCTSGDEPGAYRIYFGDRENIWRIGSDASFALVDKARVIVLDSYNHRHYTDVQMLAENGMVGWARVDHEFLSHWQRVTE